eukprot:11260555-Alexandrium_andersonii.AAC.1
MRNRLRHSKLELSGPRSGLEIDSRSFGGVRSVPFSAQALNPPRRGRFLGRLMITLEFGI